MHTKLRYFIALSSVLSIPMVKKLKYFILLILLAPVFGAFIANKKINANGIRIIVIDPGHGGKDPGCSGAVHNEKEVALAVALKLGKLLEENFKDVKVIYTRTTDVFVELEDRAQVANKAKADLFISIHCNAAGKPVMVKDPRTGKKRVKTFKNKKGKLVVVEKPNPIPFGTETYVMGLKNEEGKMKVATRENSAIFYEEDYEKKYGGFDPESEESYIIMSNYTSAYVIQSASLAMKIQEEYTKKSGRIDKGVHRQSIWVLWRTSMPSILTELGYLTNPLEETFLASEKGQDYLAKSIFRGLRRYKDEVEGKKKEYNDEFENQEPLENENVKAGNLPGQKTAMEEEGEDVSTAPVGGGSAVTEEKKPEEKSDNSIKENNESAREKVDDGAYAKLEIKNSTGSATNGAATVDSMPAGTATKPPTGTGSLTKGSAAIDSGLSAREIALKFKKETPKGPVAKEKEKQNDREVKSSPDKLRTVIYKVQFASSDVLLNLKQEKFSDVVDGDFYKMNNIMKYTSGKFEFLKDAVAHQTLLREKGYKDCFVVAFKDGKRIDIAEAKKITGQ